MHAQRTERTLKFQVGDWVMVTERQPGHPDRERVGKIVEADRDSAVAACRTRDGEQRFTFSEDTDCLGITVGVTFRRMTQADWAARKARRAA